MMIQKLPTLFGKNTVIYILFASICLVFISSAYFDYGFMSLKVDYRYPDGIDRGAVEYIRNLRLESRLMMVEMLR
jgi:hypothetical protein